MKASKIMIAVAALSAGTAFAAPAANQIAISSGASAAKGNLRLALINRCPATLTEFTAGSNISTYTCSSTGALTGATYGTSVPVNFTGTQFAELRLNVGQGSFSAVCLLNNWAGNPNCTTVDTYADPTTAGTGTVASLAAPPAGSVVVGGLTDVEATAWPTTIRAGLNVPTSTDAGVAQTFGVAASNLLYTAMFNDQKTSGQIPASCNLADTGVPACVPVIGKAQMSSIMIDDEFNTAHSNGANFLAPSVAAGTTLHYARRVDTSGTQAAAQNYFMDITCGNKPLPMVPQGTSTGTPVGAITVYGMGGTSNVRTLLNNASLYSVGILSGENAQAETWKWLRVGGMHMAENATPNLTGTNTTTSLNGTYDYWFPTKIAVSPNAGASAFWTSVKTGLTAVPVGTTKGLFGAAETTFTKAGNACQNPS